ncbi:SDR family NAD(P)-dependent oxidoreductase [Pusillimonas sp.]|uniref:SDR family NAD(P)-dependent oxidoreductase n=1 Tax=Pusillimonas sp. TaxID=3040095 RepID=UPI0029AB06DC|nr:SDR family oxidoreductase [Pusillimonas sp.]MDX3894971.1 SDR family oxidoreductase [Pusillimonas sp.]
MNREMYLDGKKILVTGAASGIGRAIAIHLAENGAIVGAADLAVPAETIAVIEKAGGRAIGLTADVSDAEQVQAMVDEAVEELDGLSGLVNNAGMYSSIIPRPFEEINLDEWRKLFDVNVYGLMSCCRSAVSHFKASGGGRIVNIISGTPFKGIPFMLHYVASKGAVLAITRSLASELGPSNILVNGVAPGFTLSEGVLDNEVQMSKLQEVSKRARSLARDQVPADVAGAVSFFLSDAAAFVTGQTMLVDGGSYFN